MVLVQVIVWECPICKAEFSSDRIPRNTEVMCQGMDHHERMIIVAEVWV